MNTARIRRATPEDAGAIARVHVAAWRETYPGIIPKKFLDALSVDDRQRMWDRLLASDSGLSVFVVEHGDGLAGFASGGAARSELIGTAGEIGAIYLLDAVKRRGIGRTLFATMHEELAARGFATIGLWVAAKNAPARRFYEALGGVAGAERTEEHQTWSLTEVAYVWV